MRTETSRWTAIILLFFTTAVCSEPQVNGRDSSPIILSVQMKKGSPIYKLNGEVVENSKENSLLTRLGAIVDTRGTNIPVFIIVDVHAPFREAGKLETALDKMNIMSGRRLFVANYRDGMMNEIHVDSAPVPLPH